MSFIAFIVGFGIMWIVWELSGTGVAIAALLLTAAGFQIWKDWLNKRKQNQKPLNTLRTEQEQVMAQQARWDAAHPIPKPKTTNTDPDA